MISRERKDSRAVGIYRQRYPGPAGKIGDVARALGGEEGKLQDLVGEVGHLVKTMEGQPVLAVAQFVLYALIYFV